MSNLRNASADPQKKYWWLILIVLPIVLAIIAITPNLSNKEKKKPSTDTAHTINIQNTGKVQQTTEKGHNFMNIQGDIHPHRQQNIGYHIICCANSF